MIILQCVTEGKKLRIRFHSYIDQDGKLYRNVYNNNYNCQFPKDIRHEGFYYRVNDNDISLVYDGSKAPFYKISKKNIEILTPDQRLELNLDVTRNTTKDVSLEELKVFDVMECVVCFAEPTNIVFVPCAHCAVCTDCYAGIKKFNNKCPLCRRTIDLIITK